MDDADLERMLATYYMMCEQAGIEPLPENEAPEQARALMALQEMTRTH